MMTAQQLLDYCLKKPHAYVDYPFGEAPACARVCKRIFAEFYPDPNDFKITLRSTPMLSDFYKQQYPGVVVRGYHCPASQQPHCFTVYVGGVDAETLCRMIDESYGTVLKKLSKKVRAELAK